MNSSLPILDNLQVASPCTVSWDEMTGDERTRFCGHCQLHVYNLGEMTRSEAEAFLAGRLGPAGASRTCVRFFRRADGTVLTQDCPVGLAAVKARVRRKVQALLSTAASMLLFVTAGCQPAQEVVNRMRNWFSPPPAHPIMGDVMPLEAIVAPSIPEPQTGEFSPVPEPQDSEPQGPVPSDP